LSNFFKKFTKCIWAEWLAISGEFLEKGAKFRPAANIGLKGLVNFTRYSAVSFLQRQPALAAKDTLISNKIDQIKTIRTFRSGSNSQGTVKFLPNF
jgi:hypothetical protein